MMEMGEARPLVWRGALWFIVIGVCVYQGIAKDQLVFGLGAAAVFSFCAARHLKHVRDRRRQCAW